MSNAVRIRADIAAMEGYSFISGTYDVLSERLGIPASQIIKLDTNENLWGPSPKVREALASLDGDAHIYPDVESRRLRALLADYVGVSADHILCGNGCDEMIGLVTRLFLESGDAILTCPPTFTMYQLTARWTCPCRIVDVPRRPDFSLDLDRIEAAAHTSNAKLLFLAVPNNPDGSMIAPADIERLLNLPLVVVLDEAYIEFTGTVGFASLVPATANLIVLRTFSKWAGLAGLRLGYGLFPLDIIKHLWKIKPPFNVNAAADAAARATLQDLPTVKTTIQKIVAERERLYLELQQIPYLDTCPSQANFLLCRVKGSLSAHELKQKLDTLGILIRDYKAAGLTDCVRISVGRPEHTDALIAALRQIGAENA